MLNVIVLAGNVVADPKTRQTTNGKSVSTVRLAVNNPMNDEEVLYIDVEVWEKQSEFVQKYVKKGNSISTTGRLKFREWNDDNGNKRTAYSVIAERINFIGSKIAIKKTDGGSGVAKDAAVAAVTKSVKDGAAAVVVASDPVVDAANSDGDPFKF